MLFNNWVDSVAKKASASTLSFVFGEERTARDGERAFGGEKEGGDGGRVAEGGGEKEGSSSRRERLRSWS